MRAIFLKEKVTAFPRKVMRYDVIQHGRQDAMTFQDGRPDVIQNGGQDVTSFKMANWMWRQRVKKPPGR